MVRPLILCLLLISCNSLQKEEAYQNKEKSDSTEATNRFIGIRAFNEDERMCMDSVSVYGLMGILDSCLEYLYVIYGNESIPGSKNTGVTIGECSIKLIGFSPESQFKKRLYFGVFMQDSIPVGFPLNLKYGQMVDGFSIDIREKKITGAYIDQGRMKIENIRQLHATALTHTAFKDYIAGHKASVHPKFKRLLKIQ